MSTPLREKLQIREGQTVSVLGAPADVLIELGGAIDAEDAGDTDVVISFHTASRELRADLPALVAARADRVAWLVYPKAGLLGTDLNRDRLAALAGPFGVRPVRQVAIDSTWSALRFRPAR